jgi:SulP family sulfate permease
MGRDFTVNKVLPDPATTRRKVAAHAFREERDCPQIAMLTLDGALFFGAAAPFAHIEDLAEVQSPKVLLLRMGNVRFMDASGQEKLAEMLRMVRDSGIIVLFSGVRPSLRELMNRTGLTDDIGADRFFAHTGEAINRALSLLDTKICRGCTHYAFQECSVLSSAQ